MRTEFAPHDESWLIRLSRDALELAVRSRARPALDALQPSAALREHRACFVTLEVDGRLRGCIGSLEAERPLFAQVAHRTWSAALGDPRFPPVAVEELDAIDIEISVLETPRALAIGGIEELATALVAGRDGLILREGNRQATFLPAVWDKLPRSAEFIAELQRKGGWTPGYWSAAIQASVYRVHTIGEDRPR